MPPLFFLSDFTHQNLGVLLGLGLKSLLTSRHAADGGGESAAGNEGGHCDCN